jgi:signal peptidase I
MFRLYRVKGPSMAPTLTAGDIVVLRTRRGKVGEIVVVNHAEFGTIIKRVNSNGDLSGDNPVSTSEHSLGAYENATPIGVAIIKITPSGLRRLSVRQPESRASSSK